MTTMTTIAEAILSGFAPPPAFTVSEWADAHRILPASSAEPGRWRTARVPYLRAVMDAVHDPDVRIVVLMKSAQVGGSEALNSVLGYHIAYDACPMLLAQPTIEMAETFSKDRLGPMLRDTLVLRGLVREGRAGSSTLRHKLFPGGSLSLAGGNSPASFAQRAVRLFVADDVDRFPPTVGEEGDPIALGIKRTTTFADAKTLLVSTPTVKGASRIETWYQQSDRREYRGPCPRCGHVHALRWSHVRWEGGRAGDPATAHLVCPACGGRIEDAERPAMLAAGLWVATAPFAGVAGFRLWEAYSPWRSLAQIVAAFLAAHAHGVETLRVWTNTTLGETWEEAGEQARPDVLALRREPYTPESLPAGVVCLTGGADVQNDRIELTVCGWGIGEECWVIEHLALPGDPARPEPWAQLDSAITTPYRHANGALLPLHALCLDTAGHRTDYAYDYVKRRQHLRVYATIGRDGDRPIVSAPSEKRFGRDPRPVRLYTIGVDMAKALLASRLQLTAKGPGYVHLPTGVDEEYLAQLTAEKLVTRYTHGIPHRHWVQTRPRNEGVDCFVLALSALRLLSPRLAEMAQLLAQAPPPPPAGAGTGPGAPMNPRRVSRSHYLAGS